MAQTMNLDLTQEEAAHLTELIEECIAKLLQVHEAMARDHAEIEQLQAETRASLNRLWKAA